MRLDRAITLNVVHPFGRALSAFRGPVVCGPVVPILMYHSISDDPEPRVSAYYQTHTRPGVFRQHLQLLADCGYHTLTLSQLVDKLTTEPWDHGTTDASAPTIRYPASSIQHPASSHQSTNPPIHQSINPARFVCLTFDDGFQDFYTEAFPVLQDFGFTATVFLPTAFIGDDRRQFLPSTLNPQSSTSKNCLTWSEVKELRRAGIEFGSHTVSHPKLVELPWPKVRSELADSKSTIEERLSEAVTTFCYPFAFPQADQVFARAFRDVLADCSYSSCATTEIGRVHAGSDTFRLKRLPANSLDDAALLAAKLDGAYDWLGSAQRLKKNLFGLRRRRSSPDCQAQYQHRPLPIG